MVSFGAWCSPKLSAKAKTLSADFADYTEKEKRRLEALFSA
jgi:hypothetical protein